MKIYLFNQETGVYLGEDFADEAPMRRGEFVIPPDATTIAPPPVESGQTPVYDRSEQRWEIRSRQGPQRQGCRKRADSGLSEIHLPLR